MKPGGFDVAAVAGGDVAELVLLNPFKNYEETDVVIRIAGPDSAQWRAASRKVTNRRLKAANRSRRLDLTAEEVEFDQIEMLASLTVGWSDTLEVDGKRYPYSYENAKDLYRRFGWITEQVDEFAKNRANFAGR